MLRYLPFILFLLLPPATFAQEEAAFSVEELVEACQKCSEDLRMGSKSRECAFCDGVLTGTTSTLALLEMNKSFCPPPDLDTHRVRNMFRRWAKEYPQHSGTPAVWGVIEAMKEAYGCP